MAYPFYQNSQIQMQELQNMRDRIDNQMRSIQQNQMQQPPVQQPQIHQSFQLVPQSNSSEIQAKYVSDINEVKNTFVMNLGLFINKEMNSLWLKNINGDIRTFELIEKVEKDPKDIEIEKLKIELENMKASINNNSNNNIDIISASKKVTKK